jgi:hypothetical protein
MAAGAVPPESSTDAAANCAAPANVVADMNTAAAALSPAVSAKTPNESPKRIGPGVSGKAARMPSRTRGAGPASEDTARTYQQRWCTISVCGSW